MIEHADILVTAWEGDRMVGIARPFTDLHYVGYLMDLAVRVSHQRTGMGLRLIEKTREHMGPRSILAMLAAPDAEGYYPKVGFQQHESAWILKAEDPLLY
jgi:predicted N-acetyltransferase YhbS